MYESYFIASTIILFLIIAVQLIRFNSVVLQLGKNRELNKATIKEQKQWEFIKGLY